MGFASFEMLFHELGLLVHEAMLMHGHNQDAIFIVENPTFHECTKHFEIDYHIILDKVLVIYHFSF